MGASFEVCGTQASDGVEADGVVWADYSGEQIVRGMLIARNTDGSLDARHQHVNAGGELPTGI
jgi:hypothetical protein